MRAPLVRAVLLMMFFSGRRPIEQPPSIADTCDDDDENALNISNIKMFIGISGPYNMVGLMHHLHERGLDVSILHYIFAFDINKYSPTLRLAKLLGKDITNSFEISIGHSRRVVAIYV